MSEKYFDQFKLNPQSFTTLLPKSTQVCQGLGPERNKNWDAK